MTEVTVERGSVVTLAVDAIVNAANERLAHGGGLAGAIAAAAGPELQRASTALAPCPTGEVRTTPGFALAAKWVIHAVGPVWRGGGHGEADLLRRAYRSVLAEADRIQARTLGVPPLSVGIFGYPLDEGCRIACDVLTRTPTDVERVHLVAFNEREHDALRRGLDLTLGR